ncbi:MAG: hypothetical protein Q8O64_21230 [Sideroxyarcus sp.]|nr:hypothetical protein [Sideroxyarcus sp.]
MAERKYKKPRTHSFKKLWKVIGNKKSAEMAISCFLAGLFVFVSAYVVLVLTPPEMHAIALSMCLIVAGLMLTPGFGDAIEFVVKVGDELPANEFFYPVPHKLDSKYRGVILPIPAKPPRNAFSSIF